jgi:NB-ARC domain
LQSAEYFVKLASESEKALTEISNMLGDIGRNLQLFEIYSTSIRLDTSLLVTLFDILVDIVLFAAFTIKNFRKSDMKLATTLVTWPNVQRRFTDTLDQIRSRMKHLKATVEAENITKLSRTQAYLVRELGNLSLGSDSSEFTDRNDELAAIPCHNLPFVRNVKFYGREKIINQIKSTLNWSNHSINSIAIWGTGGIGKSQIALEYANQQLEGGFPVIIWIPSETEVQVTSAFSNAAVKLKLPEAAESNSPDRNRYIALQWLQITREFFRSKYNTLIRLCSFSADVRWLLIFDNVEDPDLLIQNWPVSGSGCILVTCRNEVVALAPAASALEIPVFSKNEGSEFIIQMLARDVTLEERESSLELSEKLGGLPLALDMMAKQVRARRKTVTQFLPYYERNRKLLYKNTRRGIASPYYSKDLETVWKTAFENLGASGAGLMSLLCFFAPDGIPVSVLEASTEPLVGYEFLRMSEEYESLHTFDVVVLIANLTSFEDAKLELLDFALINLNPATSLISIHRLTQWAYLDRLSYEDCCKAFKSTLHLLRNAFPRQGNGKHLRAQSAICQKLIQHIQAFSDHYEELRKEGYAEYDEDLILLFSDAAWYVFKQRKLLTRYTDP